MYDDNPMIDAIANDTGRELRPGGRGAPIELVLGTNSETFVLNTDLLYTLQESCLTVPRMSS
jgi:hypothetical protein